MGSNLNNTVFLEFYGLPGCGKSTISHLVARKLRKQGKKVIEPTYIIDHKYSNSFRRFIKTYFTIKFCLFSLNKIPSLLAIIIRNGYKGNGVIGHFVNIAYKIHIYDFLTADFVIFDEGLVQSSISLTQNPNGKVSSIENLNALYKICPKRQMDMINVRVSIDGALKRLSKRKKHDSRIEKLVSNNDRKDALRKFSQQCNNVKRHYKSLDVDSLNCSVEEAASRIIKNINLDNIGVK